MMNILAITTALLLALNPTEGNTSAYNADPADSLRHVLNRADKDERPAALYAFCKYFAQIDLDSAVHYANRSLQAAKVVGDSLTMAKAYRIRGVMQMYLERMEPAIADMKLGLATAQNYSTPDEPIALFLLNDLALAYYYMGRLGLAMDYGLQYLSGVENRDKDREQNSIIALNNIGIFYVQLEDYRSALDHYKRALQLAQSIDDRHRTLLLRINIAECQNRLGTYDSAFALLRQSLVDCMKDGTCNPNITANIHMELGNTHFLTGSYTSAKQELGLVLSITYDIETVRYRVAALRLLAKIALEEGLPARAVELLDRAQKLAEEEQLRLESMHIHHMYALAYEALNNHTRASAHWKRYVQLQNELFPKSLTNTIARIQARYEEKKNLNRIANQERMLKLGEEKQTESSLWIAILGMVCGGVFIVIAITGRLYYRKRKAHKALSEQSKVLEEDNQTLEGELKDRNEQLDEAVGVAERTNDELKHLMHKISHDIRGPIATIQGLCNLGATESTNSQLEQYFTLTNGKALILDSILTRLSRTVEISNAELKIADINLLEIVKRAWQGVCEQRDLDDINKVPDNMEISYKIRKGMTVSSSDDMVYTILENVLDNTVKFCNTSRAKAPFVKVSATQHEDYTEIKVLDNGTGVPEEARQKVFMLFVRGTSVNDNTGGMGLYLATIASRQINATMKLGVNKNGHTEMTIKIPKKFIPNQLYFRGKKVATWMEKNKNPKQKSTPKSQPVNGSEPKQEPNSEGEK